MRPSAAATAAAAACSNDADIVRARIVTRVEQQGVVAPAEK